MPELAKSKLEDVCLESLVVRRRELQQSDANFLSQQTGKVAKIDDEGAGARSKIYHSAQ
jgi:hypothetical protein